jgi:hypothetical protein
VRDAQTMQHLQLDEGGQLRHGGRQAAQSVVGDEQLHQRA